MRKYIKRQMTELLDTMSDAVEILQGQKIAATTANSDG